MSLILDALKRAENERHAAENSSPVIDVIPQNNEISKIVVNKTNRILSILILILVMIIVAGWYFYRQEKKSAMVNASVNIPKNNNVSDAAQTYSSLENQIIKIEAASPAMTQAVTNLYQQQTSSSLPKVEDVQVAQLYTDKPTDTVESVSVTNPLPDANEQLPVNLQTAAEIRRIADLHDVISFNDLSYNQKKLFPSINYSQHNYLGNSASSVVINGILMRAGSRIAPDLTIEEVLEDGVLLNFYNRQVSFNALNGWINM